MRFSLASSLILVTALAAPAAAHADTITFASAPGLAYTSPSGSGTAVAYQNPAWAQAASGSQWISTSTSGGSGVVNEATTYSTTFTLLANQLYSGSIAFMADDSATITINGKTIFTGGNYTSLTSIALLSSYFQAGTNTFTIQDLNSGGGPAGVDFAATLTGAAVTPEPSTLLLLCTGLLFLLGAFSRRTRRAEQAAPLPPWQPMRCSFADEEVDEEATLAGTLAA